MIFNVYVPVKVILIWVVTTYSLVVGTSIWKEHIVVLAIVREDRFVSMKQHALPVEWNEV